MRHHRSQRSTRRFVLSQHARIGAAVTTSTTKQIMVFIRQQTDEVVVDFALFCGYIAHNLPIQPCFNLDLLFSDLSSLNRPLTHSLSPSLPTLPTVPPSSNFSLPPFILLNPLSPRNHLKSLPILLRRLQHHLLRHTHSLLPLQSGLGEPVAKILFIVTRLCASDLIVVFGPEAGTVGSENFVDENDF